MPTKSLTNLLKAAGVATPTAGMSFRQTMPGHPLANGLKFTNYVMVFSENDRDFTPSVIIPDYTTLHWTASIDSIATPNKIPDFDTTQRVTNVTVSDVYDDAGMGRGGTISIGGLSFAYASNQVVATLIIYNTRIVDSFGSEGGGDAWHSFTLHMTHTPDSYFNDSATIELTNVKARPALTGQNGPGSSPNAITTLAYQYPGLSGGANFVDFVVNVGWFSLGSGAIEIVWSFNADFSTSDGFGTRFQVYTGNVPGFTVTVYVRARIIHPYVSPYTTISSITFTDPRPGA